MTSSAVAGVKPCTPAPLGEFKVFLFGLHDEANYAGALRIPKCVPPAPLSVRPEEGIGQHQLPIVPVSPTVTHAPPGRENVIS
jgi:hypothetical protein